MIPVSGKTLWVIQHLQVLGHLERDLHLLEYSQKSQKVIPLDHQQTEHLRVVISDVLVVIGDLRSFGGDLRS